MALLTSILLGALLFYSGGTYSADIDSCTLYAPYKNNYNYHIEINGKSLLLDIGAGFLGTQTDLNDDSNIFESEFTMIAGYYCNTGNDTIRVGGEYLNCYDDGNFKYELRSLDYTYLVLASKVHYRCNQTTGLQSYFTFEFNSYLTNVLNDYDNYVKCDALNIFVNGFSLSLISGGSSTTQFLVNSKYDFNKPYSIAYNGNSNILTNAYRLSVSFDYIYSNYNVLTYDADKYNPLYDSIYDKGGFDSLMNNGTYQNGYDAGYQEGYRIGGSTTYQTAYDEGNAVGYANGLRTGNQEGYRVGYDEGYDLGSSTGYTSGYNTGYNEGASGNNNFTFLKLFGAVADTPIIVIRQLLGFDVFGVSGLQILMSMITGTLAIFLLRRFVF